MSFCTKCGKQINDDLKVCEECTSNEKTNKRELIERIGAILLYFVGYQGVGAFIALALATVISTITDTPVDLNNIHLSLPFCISLFIVELIILTIYLIVFKSIINITKIDFIEIKKKLKFTLIAAVIIIAANFLISFILGLFIGSSENQNTIIDSIKISPFTLGFTTIIFAPIVEEIIFRGAIYNLIEKYLNTKAALIISSIIFGLIHVAGALLSFQFQELLFLINYSLIGLGLGYVYYKTKNIYLCISIHMLNNLIGFIQILLTI